jgi:hypothetical protein
VRGAQLTARSTWEGGCFINDRGAKAWGGAAPPAEEPGPSRACKGWSSARAIIIFSRSHANQPRPPLQAPTSAASRVTPTPSSAHGRRWATGCGWWAAARPGDRGRGPHAEPPTQVLRRAWCCPLHALQDVTRVTLASHPLCSTRPGAGTSPPRSLAAPLDYIHPSHRPHTRQHITPPFLHPQVDQCRGLLHLHAESQHSARPLALRAALPLHRAWPALCWDQASHASLARMKISCSAGLKSLHHALLCFSRRTRAAAVCSSGVRRPERLRLTGRRRRTADPPASFQKQVT